ncbi:MAG: hypothetical protein ABR549_06755 [Mycobacteriales bacterium]
MKPRPRRLRLQSAAILTLALFATTACGLKSSAMSNLKQAPAGAGGVSTGDATTGGSGAATGATSGSGATGALQGTSGAATSGLLSTGSSGTSTGSSGTSGATGGATSGTSGATGTTGSPAGPCAVPSGGTTTGITKSSITIGLHAPLTGTGTPFPSTSFQKGSQAFWNAPGHTVCGRKVHVDFEDDTYTPDGANRVCSQFAKTSFIALGGAGTDQIQACATNTDIVRSGTPYLSAGVTDNGLKGLSNYFAVSLTYQQQGALVVRNAMQQGFAKPKASSDGKQWAIVTGKSANFNSATTGITQALDAAHINYKVTRFDQNSGNYDAAATNLGQQLALQGYKTIFVDAAPGVFVFMVKGYYNAAPTGSGVRWTAPGVTYSEFLVGQLICQSSANAISGAADVLAPFPGIDHATADFKKAYGGSYDDIEWSLWGLSATVFEMLKAASNNLTRQNFINTALHGSFTTGIYAPSAFNGSHFGGTGAWVQRINCSKHNPNQPSGAQGNGQWDTIGSNYLRP